MKANMGQASFADEAARYANMAVSFSKRIGLKDVLLLIISVGIIRNHCLFLILSADELIYVKAWMIGKRLTSRVVKEMVGK